MITPYRAPDASPMSTSAHTHGRPAVRSSNTPDRASMPPTYPTTPQAYICHGLHNPWPKKKLLVSAASAPTMKPLRGPNVAPAMMAIAESGLKSGMGANRMRPAAAHAASTSVGMIWRSAGWLRSYPRKNRTSTNVTTTIMSSAAFAAPVGNAAPMTRGTAASSAISRMCPHMPLKRISSPTIMAGRTGCCGRTRPRAPCRQARRRT